jgi:PA14 domain/Chitobiase/beta-hexosaminidase C-terminal domain/Concanavalin A-like lectin/glucanases superfamily/Heparinase II/III-like protein
MKIPRFLASLILIPACLHAEGASTNPPVCSIEGTPPPVTRHADGTEVRKLTPPPAPGVHPRIFLSPEDLPELRRLATSSPARKNACEALRKTVRGTLDNPVTPEGKILVMISEGKTPTDAQFAAASDLSHQLALAAIDAQVADNGERGKLLGRILSAEGAYLLRTWHRPKDPVGLHNGWDSYLCLAYDFLAPWMPEEQRSPVRKFIARMMDGINIFTHDWPAHMRMWNWAGLHVYQGWGSLAIEGEEGWNPKLWNQAKEVARDFCRYNIHESGSLTEDLTYFSLGFQGAGLVMMADAKRGGEDVWAEGSNAGKLKNHLVNQLHPWGGEFMSHADGSGSGFYSTWTILKYMYPTDPMIDWAWRQRVGEDYATGGAGNDRGTREWLMVLFNTEHLPKGVPPSEMNLPTTYFCPKRGYLVARSGWDTDALKLDFEAKTDYPVVGHNHADANNFTLSALGREWATEVGYHAAAGPLHNNVLIDGRSESPWPAPEGRWIDLVDTPEVTLGVSDAEHAYTWRWTDSGYGVDNTPPTDIDEKWELETQPDVREFVREQVESGKGRQSIFEHHGPVLRGEWNPVQKAFRTAALVRGQHPYVLMVDDIRKDDSSHLYEWAMHLPPDLEIIKSGGNWVDLGAREIPADPKVRGDKPKQDKRRLLVQVLNADLDSQADAMAIRIDQSSIGNRAFDQGALHKRLLISARSKEPRFKILLYPHREGEPLPDVLWNQEHDAVSIRTPGQEDLWTFAPAAGGRTAMALERDGKTLVTAKATPPSPEITTPGRLFTAGTKVSFRLPGPGQEIRYTLDGSRPGPDSTFYAGPFSLDQTTVVKAVTVARDWKFGKEGSSPVTEEKFTRAEPGDPVKAPDLEPGLKASVHTGFWNNLPDFNGLKAEFTDGVDSFVFPPATPGKGFGVLLEGYIRVPADGVYTFALRNDDAAKLWIDDRLVVDNDGAHVVRTRSGEIALKEGLHRIKAANCDMALALGTAKGDGSWAFDVLWALPGAGLTPVPEEILFREKGLPFTAPKPLAVQAVGKTDTEPGLLHSTFDRSVEKGSPSYFETPPGKLRLSTAVRSIIPPDSDPGLLNVHEGYLRVRHPGIYAFRLPVAGLAELEIGGQPVARIGLEGSDLSRAVELPAGLVSFRLKAGKLPEPLLWKGPGMDWQPVPAADLLRKAGAVKTIRQGDLLGDWRASKFKGGKLVNQADSVAGPIPMPDGVQLVADPAEGNVLRLDHSPVIRLDPTGILANELTVVIRFKSDKDASLFRYGYAHFGIFANIAGGNVSAAGGGLFNVAASKGEKLRDGKWHTAAFTFGGSPVRGIKVYLDGELQGEGRSKSPCLTDNLELLKDFTGDLSFIRLYNRILTEEEIRATDPGKRNP